MEIIRKAKYMRYIYKYSSPIGELLLSSNGEKLTGLWFDKHINFKDENILAGEYKFLPVFEQTVKWLDIYFSGENPDFTPPLQLEGTPFRKSVWEILRKIPYGKVTTYGDIARQIGRQKGVGKMSAQAVGGAVGHNPISIIVPCHRVVGANGNLTGFGGGIDKKIALLKLEKVDMKGFFVPKKGTAL